MGKRNDKKNVFSVSMLLFLLLLLLPLALSLAPSASGQVRWVGVDESVVEKIAKEHGREAQDSLINTDKGDLLLFVFLAAGSIAGFAAGYYWRILLEGRQKTRSEGAP